MSHSACEDVDFAVKGGTHAPAAGFANIDEGITIDMSGLNSLGVNEDQSVAMVGAGNKWLDTYAYLEPMGKTVAGGRNGAVGVGGLTLGGGISYYAPQVGWTCDTVVNFELVLASGELVNANATSNPDLYRALKGGTNNLGVVTRFDLITVPLGKILVGSVVNDISYREDVFTAFSDIATAEPYDVHASIVMSLIFNSTAKSWALTSTPAYTLPERRPKVYKPLFSVPHITQELPLVNLSVVANETALPPLNWQFWTGTYGVSAELLSNIFDNVNSSVYSFDGTPGITWIITFEPLPAIILSHGAGKNSLGTSAQDAGMILLMTVLWPDSTRNDAVHAKAAKIVAEIHAAAKSMGMLKEFVYANYADSSQQPLLSYGSGNVQFLKKIAKQYDPHAVFQKRVPGGFKLPS